MRAWSSVGKGWLFFQVSKGSYHSLKSTEGGWWQCGRRMDVTYLWNKSHFVIYVGTGLCTSPARLCWAVREPEQGCVVLEPAWMPLKLYQAVRTLLWWWHLVAPRCTRSPQSWDPAWAKHKSLLTSWVVVVALVDKYSCATGFWCLKLLRRKKHDLFFFSGNRFAVLSWLRYVQKMQLGNDFVTVAEQRDW